MNSAGMRRTVTQVRRRVAVALVAPLAALLSLQVVVAPAAGAATPTMYRDQAYRVGGATEDKPQS